MNQPKMSTMYCLPCTIIVYTHPLPYVGCTCLLRRDGFLKISLYAPVPAQVDLRHHTSCHKSAEPVVVASHHADAELGTCGYLKFLYNEN